MNKIIFRKPIYRWLFSGVGFHNSEATMTPMMTDDFKNERVIKCYRELSPTFSRLFAGYPDWTQSAMDRFADYYHATFATNDCSLYLVPGRMKLLETEAEERDFAEQIACRLEYLIKERDCRLIRYFCCTNELSVENRWGVLSRDFDKFKRIHTELWRSFRRHGLDIALTATDTSDFSNFNQIKWATDNMDEVTGVYCAHNYSTGGYEFGDPALYDYLRAPIAEAVRVAKNREKRFILGEFGIHTTHFRSDVMRDDVPDGYGDPRLEAESALMACVEAVAAMNAGALAIAYWTMVDYPDPFLPDNGHTPESIVRNEVARFSGHGTAIRYNKNGLIRWSEDGDYSPRAYYFSLGLLARYFRKNSRLLSPECDDPSFICTGATNPDGSVSLCVINYSDSAKSVAIESEHEIDKPYRVLRYSCKSPIANEFGDLPSFSEVCTDGSVLELEPYSLALLTTDYVDRTPSRVTGVAIDGERMVWSPCDDGEHCYYRIFAKNAQIGSTVAEYFTLRADMSREVSDYRVVSVDRYGNEGK